MLSPYLMLITPPALLMLFSETCRVAAAMPPPPERDYCFYVDATGYAIIFTSRALRPLSCHHAMIHILLPF